MNNKNDRSVFKRDGEWHNKRDGAQRSESKHSTQREAEAAARETLKNQGGGELKTMGENGRIRSKDTIPPGNESTTKDKEH